MADAIVNGKGMLRRTKIWSLPVKRSLASDMMRNNRPVVLRSRRGLLVRGYGSS